MHGKDIGSGKMSNRELIEDLRWWCSNTGAPVALVKAAITALEAMEEWQLMETAPRDGTEIEVIEGGTVFWSERPVCMLGSRNGGFPPGWATGHNSGTDYNLPVDPPTHWRPLQASEAK